MSEAGFNAEQHPSVIFQAIWNTVVDGMILINRTGVIQMVNPATTKIFGYGENELIGRNVKMLMPERYSMEHDSYLSMYMKTGQNKVIGTGRTVEGRRKDGKELSMYLAVSAMQMNDQTFFVGILRDLTDKVNAEKAILVAKEEAERANFAKSRFLSSMSHELRTPLNTIIGFAQLLQVGGMKEMNSDSYDEFISYILKSGDHLLALINDILDLSKIEADTVSVLSDDVDVHAVINECLHLTSVNTSPGNITISTSMNLPSGISVRADRVRLRQVVINLLTNAIKYNRPGGTVTVHGEMVDDNMVRITIADTGIGIPKAYQSEIFTPFNRLGHENSTIDGSGIGLAITRRLVQMMQGHIDFSSDKTGTRFWVELPAGRAGAVVEPGFHNEGLQLDTRTLSGCRILYIEDNPSNVALITNLLHKLDAGIGIDSCATAERGIQMADSADYDLIFMDINLPGMSGIEALKRLENGRRKCPPVVAITADVSAPTMRQVEQGNFCGILTKPINITETIKLIEQNV